VDSETVCSQKCVSTVSFDFLFEYSIDKASSNSLC